ncbi:MAG: hypothetical protein ACR2Q4_07920, partial [Geminicoccaceae bacterium]
MAEIFSAKSPPSWSPSGLTVEFDKVPDLKDARAASFLVSHPATPFIRRIQGEADEPVLQSAAYDYLTALRGVLEAPEIRERLGLPDRFEVSDHPDQDLLDPVFGWPSGWLRSLSSTTSNQSLKWAPIDSSGQEGEARSLASSINAVRHEGKRDETRTVVLLATEFADGKFLGSDFGLYVIIHIVPNAVRSDFELRISAMHALIPSGKFLGTTFDQSSGDSPAVFTVDELFSALPPLIERRLQLDKLVFRKVRLFGNDFGKGKGSFEIRGNGAGVPSKKTGVSTPYEFVVEGARFRPHVEINRFEKSTLTVNAVPEGGAKPDHARVFLQDPMSSQTNPDAPDRERRPTRSEETLDAYREARGPFPDPLEDPPREDHPEGDFKVRRSRFVKVDHDELPTEDAKSVALPGGHLPAVRSNDFSAVSAYYMTQQFFQRMRDYGFDPKAYFRKYQLPLHVFYRSGLKKGPGKDGQGVNAQVRPSTCEPTPLSRIEVHLMLANLSHRARAPWNRKDRTQAEPIGLAVDARWMWHEFGHVLLLAAHGEKEFPFAHSCGDALAAIVADPHSRLADRDRGRGVTFPWAFVTRRHDRCVLNGWAWGGTMDPLSRLPASVEAGKIKGYRAEQILSTSLFRLYRCLGGDTRLPDGTPDRDARERAAHYVVYLIMQAIQCSGICPQSVEQFAHGLVQADVGTTAPFSVKLESGVTSRDRTGGSARKLIRWAFEAQGLYQPASAGSAIVNAPGAPEDVDIYIADHRPFEETMDAGTVT